MKIIQFYYSFALVSAEHYTKTMLILFHHLIYFKMNFTESGSVFTYHLQQEQTRTVILGTSLLVAVGF